MRRTIAICILFLPFLSGLNLILMSQIGIYYDNAPHVRGTEEPYAWTIRNIIGTLPPSSGDWNISDITVVEYEDLIINGSIFIENGGALILRNSTIRMNLVYDGEHWIEVFTGGNLTIINSTVTAYNTTNNYYIKVDSGAKFYMDGGEISYAGYDYGGSGEKTGLWINTDNVIVKNSKIHDNFDAMFLFNAENITISDNVVDNCRGGISLDNVRKSIIINNKISYIAWNGIHMKNTHDNIISHNTITDCMYGIYAWLSNDYITSNNISYNTWRGIYLSDSERVFLSNNLVSNNFIGLDLDYCNSFIISSNRFYNNGLWFEINTAEISSMVISENNTVNDKNIKVYYSTQDLEIKDEVIGELILISCKNITITNITTYGIELIEATNITIKNSKVSNSDFGIYLYNSIKCMIMSNIISNTKYGVQIGSASSFNTYKGASDYNLIYKNSIKNCHFFGITLDHSSNNLIINNSLEGILKGLGLYYSHSNSIMGNWIKSSFIEIRWSDNNQIYLNNFINSHVYDEENNIFDTYIQNAGYYGNYWSNYNGTDSNDDMIGDTPYYIDLNSIDHYPLMFPVRQYSTDIYYLQNLLNNGSSIYYLKIKIIPIKSGKTLFVQVNYTLNGAIFYENMTYDPVTDTYNWQLNSKYYPWNLSSVDIFFDYAPEIRKITQSPEEPTSIQNVTISVYLVDDHKVTRAILSYRPKMTSIWTNITMTYNTATALWEATIPDAPAGTTIYYKIYACDNAGNWVVSATYSYTVIAGTSQQPSEHTAPSNPPNSSSIDPTWVMIGIGSALGFIAVMLLRRPATKKMSFEKIYAGYIDKHGTIDREILNNVHKSRRIEFARWLSDKLVQEGKIDLATDILEGGGLYEEAASTAISQAIHYRGLGDIERAKSYYRKAAELLKKAGKATEAEEIEEFIQRL